MSVLTSVLLTVPDTVTGLTATKDSGDTQIEVEWDTLSGCDRLSIILFKQYTGNSK